MKFTYKDACTSVPLKTPISFPVQVLGKDLIATISGLVNDPILNVFDITFSDDYHDIFTMTEDGDLEPGNKKAGKAYAFVIKDDLECLCLLSIDTRVWNFKFPEIEGNIWVKQSEKDGSTIFYVYTEGDYHFHIMKEGDDWVTKNARIFDPRDINEALAAEVISLLKEDSNVTEGNSSAI